MLRHNEGKSGHIHKCLEALNKNESGTHITGFQFYFFYVICLLVDYIYRFGA